MRIESSCFQKLVARPVMTVSTLYPATRLYALVENMIVSEWVIWKKFKSKCPSIFLSVGWSNRHSRLLKSRISLKSLRVLSRRVSRLYPTRFRGRRLLIQKLKILIMIANRRDFLSLLRVRLMILNRSSLLGRLTDLLKG